jgi:hypothetical protein
MVGVDRVRQAASAACLMIRAFYLTIAIRFVCTNDPARI